MVESATAVSLMQFLSTPSTRRATKNGRRCRGNGGYFYPRPPRGGRLVNHYFSVPIISISIHALREEGDGSLPTRNRSPQHFYPRPPRGGRLGGGQFYATTDQFLSTPSARRATIQDRPETPKGGISIHALREEGDWPVQGCTRQAGISIHALREEGDGVWHCPNCNHRVFLSTPSARRATRRSALSARHPVNFYPRPPRGGRPRPA